MILTIEEVSFSYHPAAKQIFSQHKKQVAKQCDKTDVLGSKASEMSGTLETGEALETGEMSHTPNLALQSISFSVAKGEVLALLGRSGSGKSTLINLMAGLLEPQTGQVLYRLTHQAKRGLVFQFPERQLFAQTVFDDVAFGPKNLGLSAHEVHQRVYEALDQVNLSYTSLKDQSPFALSTGQQRRVALAGVLAMRPELLLMDEPLAGLDRQAHDEIIELLGVLNQAGMTMVIASHDMEDIAQMADRVLVIDQGHIRMLDTPERVFAQEAKLVSCGLDVPCALSFVHKLRAAGFLIPEELYTTETLACAIKTALV